MLEGIRVIDFSQYLPGPHTTLRLADLGAEIIKVESPYGDPARNSLDDNGAGYVFLAQNRKKKSIVLNLKDKKDQELALKLIAEADVVLESFRPGVIDRLGIGYDEAVKVKKDIIYCSLTGYGQTGRMSHLGGHDLNYLSLSGMLSQLKDKDGRPVQPSNTIADFIGGISASESILAALVKRFKTGEGSYIDLSITDSLVPLMSNHVMIANATGEEHGVDKLNNKLVCYYLYETSDHRFVSLGALEPKFWQNFCKAVGKEAWVPAHLSLAEESNPTFEELKALFASRTFAEWCKFSLEIDCCLAPVLETSEIVNHPLMKDRGLIVKTEDLCYTLTNYHALDISAETAPEFGEHTEQIISHIEGKVK
ncbi:CoA transferase [Bacillus sp. AGMB 02131]|uniref:CoA transferase n=1 Tax=Peribacillus faecalis TaxID=2772559 RepID=A0A927CX19_9BACI|nr:CoA transferase [Peribacillus faecalis]MBD3109213.1 CoA transferase [Peribacillus faecalis]